jgi:hypothetical protein
VIARRSGFCDTISERNAAKTSAASVILTPESPNLASARRRGAAG